MIGSLQATLTKEKCEILRAALYFDIFKYPLTRQELYEASAVAIPQEQFTEELNRLLDLGFLQELNGYVLCRDRDLSDLEKRLNGNEGARKIMPVALKFSQRIARFPFVEGVCLSGGLSKNYYDEKSDIDFFIVTKPGRLWICRSLLILCYKFLPKHLKKYWCVNYFISSDNLGIPDANVFTATELAYLLPTINYPLYQSILDKNDWYRTRFPNKQLADPSFCLNASNNLMKRLVERLLAGKVGSRLDDLLLRLTLKRWRKKYPTMKDEDFELQFRSRKDVCKRHTLGFQNRVLVLWEEKTRAFEEHFQIKIS